MSEEVKSKDYHKGYLTALESCMMLFNAHKFNVDGFEVELSEAIEYERRYIQHLPSFKVDGKETPQEELSKTPIQRKKVHVDAIGRIHTNKPDYSGLPKLEPGTDGSRSNKPVGDEATGGCKPDVNSAIEALAKATHVPVHLVKGSKDITEGRTMPVVHNIYVIPDHFAGFKNRVFDYIMVPPPKTEFYSVGDQIIISEVSCPTYEKTGDHMHVMVKNLQAIGDKILLLFDMSGDF